MRSFFIVLACLFIIHMTTAQVIATASLDSTHLLIGDQLKLYIEVSHPAGTIVEPPVLKQPQEPKVEFIGQSSWDTLKKGATVHLKKNLVFTAWDTGYQQVPALPLVFQQNGNRDTVFTKAIPINVGAPPMDSILADIKPIIEEPVKLEDYLPYAWGLLILVLLVLLFIFLWKRKKAPEVSQEPIIIKTPHEIAMEKLEALKRLKLWQQGEIKAYHSELTYIIREYLENRYDIAALENTTGEILQQMRKLNLSKEVSEKLDIMLHTADLVKFAKAQPTADVHEIAMTYAGEFISASKPALALYEETESDDV